MLECWESRLNWNTPAGELIDRLVASLDSWKPQRIYFFGLAPLQLYFGRMTECGTLNYYLAEEENFALEIDPWLRRSPSFQYNAATCWIFRSQKLTRQEVQLFIPHPLDLLCVELVNGDERVFRAFKRINEQTGHPTEDELLGILKEKVDWFRKNFDGSETNMRGDVQWIWRELFGRDLNVSEEIIRPALKERGW